MESKPIEDDIGYLYKLSPRIFNSESTSALEPEGCCDNCVTMMTALVSQPSTEDWRTTKVGPDHLRSLAIFASSYRVCSLCLLIVLVSPQDELISFSKILPLLLMVKAIKQSFINFYYKEIQEIVPSHGRTPLGEGIRKLFSRQSRNPRSQVDNGVSMSSEEVPIGDIICTKEDWAYRSQSSSRERKEAGRNAVVRWKK